MTPFAFLTIAWVTALALLLACIAAALIEAIGRQRIADWLRLDLGDEDES